MKAGERATKRPILIVEDHARTRDALVFLLQRHGYQARVATNGRQALDVLMAADGPTIALLDWMMPEVTGLDVCRAIRQASLDRYVYLIMVTGRDGVEDLVEAFDAGADDFIRKPCDPMELLARLRSGERIVELERRLSNRLREFASAEEGATGECGAKAPTEMGEPSSARD
jgi:DNA-binding response OmpR family regulator